MLRHFFCFTGNKEGEDQLDIYSHSHCIDLLLKAGTDLTCKNQDGNTPLHVCAASADLTATKLLVNHDADLHATNNSGQTPLFFVKTPHILHYFLEQGADVHRTSNSGDSVLHMYSRADVAVALVTGLLSWEINVNAQNTDGDTALHYACQSGNCNKVAVLISSGANVDIPNAQGKFPVQVALDRKHLDIVNLLLDKMTDVNNQDKDGRTLLHTATQQGNGDLVKDLHNRGADLNIRDKSQNNTASIAAALRHHSVLMYLLTNGAELTTFTDKPLHYFAGEGCTAVVQILHQQGHDINSSDSSGHTVLHCALLAEQWDTALYLLRHKTPANSSAHSAATPLHTAIEKCRDVNLIAMLIDNQADVNAPNTSGKSPLHLSMQHNSLEVSMHLVEMGADINRTDNENNSPILVGLIRATNPATNNNEIHVETVNFLLEAKSEVNVRIRNNLGKTALHYAAELGQGALVRQLISLGGEVNVQDHSGSSPLMYACHSKQCVEILLRAGAAVNTVDEHGETALYKSISSCAHDSIHLLLCNEADPDIATAQGITCLHQSLEGRNYDAMELLLANEADVNKVDDSGMSALHIAAQTAPHDIVRILLEHGASMETADNTGKTPLHYSVLNMDKSVASLLLLQGIDIEAPDSEGERALHVAAANMSYDHVTVFLDEGADVDASDNLGYTALHLAAQSRQETDVLELLISHEANVNVRNHAQETPFLLALSHGNVSAATILLDYDADVDVRDATGETALHKVVRIHNVRPAFVQSLTRRGLSAHTRNSNGQTPVDVLKNLKRTDEQVLLQAMGVEELV